VEEFCTAMSCCCRRRISSIELFRSAKLFSIAHKLGCIIELRSVASLVEAELHVSSERLLEAVSVANACMRLPSTLVWSIISRVEFSS
jgi:hypothetical protein